MKRFIVIAAMIVSPVMSAYAGTIDWMVANGFQQFKHEEDFKALKDAWPKGATAEAFLATQDAQKLRELLPFNDTWWERDKGLYNKTGLFKPTHDVLVNYKGAADGSTCAWSFNGKGVTDPTPCTTQFRIEDVQENKTFDLSVSIDNGPPETLAAQKISTSLIVGLGDSFASGEGNPDFAAVTSPQHLSVNTRDWFLQPSRGNRRFVEDAQWWDVTCHRSLLSWQSLYAMKMAVADPHKVVRFASFSCSGGEVYDGFFRAQLAPPGTGDSSRVGVKFDRDGGNTTEIVEVREEKRPAKNVEMQNFSKKRQLNKSQLNATIDLLCNGDTSPGLSYSFRPQRSGLRSSPYYGLFKYDKCSGQMRKPDQVLMSFGGNDFGFSGVVAWGLVPKTAVRGLLKPIRSIGLSVAREVLGTVKPVPAGVMATNNMGLMYDDLAWTFDNVLKVKRESVHELVYPNPLPYDFPTHCSARMEVGNVAMASYFVDQTKNILFLNERARYFIFRVEQSDARIIKKDFIDPLQASQRASIKKLGWTHLEAQTGFMTSNGMRSMCGVAPECQKGFCEVADLAGWAKEKSENHASMQPIADISEWESYAPTRMRGLRTSNDAVLSLASFDSNGKLRKDWLNGSVHPVAQVHAGIADAIDKK
ncbi:hypothetical protein [Pseudomonas veronii]|uniref:SGNH/GDSL hydrolase family protein n=1 Tax=Pseudomonas veronii TaxID=76761 RepID=A0A7Y1FCF6_PSEVE|nr:hypothetical protein [Pseudomonas veronii]NMY12669.1 hypothetical protein [Pseudomonas veronii]